MILITKDSTASPVKYSNLGSTLPYSSIKQYYLGEIATLASINYRCILPSLGNAPPNVTYWELAPYDPIKVFITIDGTGTPATVEAYSNETVFIWANNLNRISDPIVSNYSNVELAVIGTLDPGITWVISLDNITFSSSIALPGILDVSAGHASTLIYVKAVAVNGELLVTGNYTMPKLRVTAAENPVV